MKMTRQALTQAIKQAAMRKDYCFYPGCDHRIAETIVAYPAAWLSPLKIVGVTGCREGKIRYRCSLQLMTLAKKMTEEQKECVWSALEQDALEIVRMIARNGCIATVQVAECAPAEFSLTNHGEVSMGLKFDVEMPFCEASQR